MNLTDPTATHLPILDGLLSGGEIKRVLEFGCGLYSTKLFADYLCDVTAIEMQSEEWYQRVKKECPDVELWFALGPDAWRKLPLDDRYDLIFVDGHGDSRPECLMWAKDRSNVIVAHDTEHPYYCWDRADMSGFDETVYKDNPPWTTVWRRK